MTLPELIEALKKATGPSKELDRAIRNFVMGDGNELAAPDYTSSIDAAMTLVPDKVRPNGAPQEAFPRVLKFSATRWDANIGYGNSAIGQNGSGANGAIALCIAALEARRQP